MAQRLPVWWLAVEVVEDHQDMRSAHRADGEVDQDERDAECADLRLRVLPAVVRVAKSQTLAQAVARNGEDSDRVVRLLREWGDDDPAGPAALAA